MAQIVRALRMWASIAALVVSTPLYAKSWEEAIRDVSALADRYEEAVEASGTPVTGYIGNQGLTEDYQMHMCAILGRRMGHVEQIRHLEPPQPSFDEPPSSLAWNVRSLRHWVRAAERFSDMSLSQRQMHWNLECVGKHGISADSVVMRDPGVFFEWSEPYLYVHGDILPGFHAELLKALYEHPDAQFIGLGSGGGAVIEAIKAGILIRSLGLKTQLSGDCYSACPLVFAAGVERMVMKDYPQFGLHAISRDGRPVPEDDPIYSSVELYLMDMGVDAEMLIRLMQSKSPSEMGVMTPQLSCLSGLVTWHQHGAYEGHC